MFPSQKQPPALRSVPWSSRARLADVRGSAAARALAVFFIFACAAVLAAARPAQAAVAPVFAATELIRSAQRVELAPGGSQSFTIGFKNTGSAAWRSEGGNFLSVYTFDPKYRKSVFADASWMNDVQPARLTEAAVAPGQVGRFSFTLYAPLEAGTYRETFALAAESLAWIPGGKFTVEIAVSAAPSIAVPVAGEAASGQRAAGYKALQLLVSDRQLSLDAGAVKEFRVGFKNIGRTVWKRGGDAPLAIKAEPGSNAYSFRDASWSDVRTAAQPSSPEVQPGELSFFNFKLSAPRSAGVYLARFTLTAGDDLIDGGEVDIPIEVRQGTVPAAVSPAGQAPLSNSGARGPDIRVGLFSPDDPARPVTLTADGPYRLMDGAGNAVTTLSGPTSVVFDPDSRTYAVGNGSFRQILTKYLYFEPADPSTIFEITSYENRPSWDQNVNFNRFRGRIEIFFALSTRRLWVVEQLPVEDYLRGLAETSNGSPYEYQKALVTAARTYALFVVSVGGKHQSEFFDLNTTGGDQVYKGYSSEVVRPNVVRAVEDTRGMVVTYGGEIVVTPYFSRSDGRTRAWTEVWGSNHHPWLISKPAPYDQGQTLWGHGVGLSANDAAGRAADGVGWEAILKYYYTGIELKRLY